VAALLPLGCVSWSVGDLVLCVGGTRSPMLQDTQPRGNNTATKRANLDPAPTHQPQHPIHSN